MKVLFYLFRLLAATFTECRRLRDRIREQFRSALMQCMVFILRPVFWVLRYVWRLFKPTLWPILRPVVRPIVVVLGAHFGWLEKRYLLWPAMYFYYCVFGFLFYNPSDYRAEIRSQYFRMHSYESVNVDRESVAGDPKGSSKSSNDNSLHARTESEHQPRRPSTFKRTRRGFWLPNIGVAYRQGIEQGILEEELKAEARRQAKALSEENGKYLPSPVSSPSVPPQKSQR